MTSSCDVIKWRLSIQYVFIIYFAYADSIEANVDAAVTHVEQGNVQLTKARDYQKKSRRKMCILVIILLIVAVVLGVIIYLGVRN